MPEWMLLERTSISKNHLPDCRGNTPKALFETAKIYLRVDHDGKLIYCTQPILNTCFAVATRAASDAWKKQRAESSVISSNAQSGSYNPAHIARSFGGPNTPPGTPIVVTFDRNKGALYALYGRALRTNPQLKGKVVFELMISVTGEVTSCRLVSSELHDTELERKLVARVGLIRFGPQDAPVTVAMPVDFYPADS